MAKLSAHPPIDATMTYMQKLRNSRSEATGFIPSAAIARWKMMRVMDGWMTPPLLLLPLLLLLLLLI